MTRIKKGLIGSNNMNIPETKGRLMEEIESLFL
jgi:hypothetical protein